MGKWVPSNIAGTNIKKKIVWQFLKKSNIDLPPDSAIPLILPRNKNIQNFHMNASSRTIHNSQNVQTTQKSINWWRDAVVVVVVQSSSCVRLFATPWTAAWQDSLSLTISPSLPKVLFTASVMPSSHLILWCPLLSLPSIFSSMRDFPMSHLFAPWAKYWRFSFSISPSNEYSGCGISIQWNIIQL